MYCKNCGKQIDENSKFCQFCGCPIFDINRSRNTYYEGEIYKCPNCGEPLNSFTAFCPACGHEIRKKYYEKTRLDCLLEKLQSCFTLAEKNNLIDSFVVPNTHEDIIRFSTFIKDTIRPDNVLNDAFFRMINRISSQAKLLYSDRPNEYKNFMEIYDATRIIYESAKTETERHNEQRKKEDRKNKLKEAKEKRKQKRDARLQHLYDSLRRSASEHPFVVMNLIFFILAAIFTALGIYFIDLYSWLLLIGISLIVADFVINLFLKKHPVYATILLWLYATCVLVTYATIYFSTLWYLLLLPLVPFVLIIIFFRFIV